MYKILLKYVISNKLCKTNVQNLYKLFFTYPKILSIFFHRIKKYKVFKIKEKIK